MRISSFGLDPAASYSDASPSEADFRPSRRCLFDIYTVACGSQPTSAKGASLCAAAPRRCAQPPVRRLALRGTEFERACAATIRLKLLKIGAAVVRNTRRVQILLASSHPLRHVFLGAAARRPLSSQSAVPGTLTSNGGKGSYAPARV